MLRISALPALTDNYIWLIERPADRQCAVVDPGDASPVLGWLAQHPDWQLTDILVTHHHADHVGGISVLQQHTGARVIGPAHEAIPKRTIEAKENTPLHVLGYVWQVLELPGHTLGHVAYLVQTAANTAPCLFSGDTLFAGGCGRVFEGTMEQMFHSLCRLAALPAQTQIYCAHEYTEANLRFAQQVEPHNQQIAERLNQVRQQRNNQQITLPSTLKVEHMTNPFLRTECPEVQARVLQQNALLPPVTSEQIFTLLREWKNRA